MHCIEKYCSYAAHFFHFLPVQRYKPACVLAYPRYAEHKGRAVHILLCTGQERSTQDGTRYLWMIPLLAMIPLFGMIPLLVMIPLRVVMPGFAMMPLFYELQLAPVLQLGMVTIVGGDVGGIRSATVV